MDRLWSLPKDSPAHVENPQVCHTVVQQTESHAGISSLIVEDQTFSRAIRKHRQSRSGCTVLIIEAQERAPVGSHPETYAAFAVPIEEAEAHPAMHTHSQFRATHASRVPPHTFFR